MGKVHSSTILGWFLRSVCSMATMTVFAPAARSMAPPTLPTPRSGKSQLAKIALGGHLVRTQHGDVYVAAPDHGEGLGGTEVCHSRGGLQELPAGVDEVDVLFPFVGQRPAVEYAALAVVEDRPALRKEVGHQGRNADAQVDKGAVGQLFGHPHGDDFTVQPFLIDRCAHSLSAMVPSSVDSGSVEL